MRAGRGQQVAGLARHSGPTSKVKHTAMVPPTLSFSLSVVPREGAGKRGRGEEDKIKGGMW